MNKKLIFFFFIKYKRTNSSTTKNLLSFLSLVYMYKSVFRSIISLKPEYSLSNLIAPLLVYMYVRNIAFFRSCTTYTSSIIFESTDIYHIYPNKKFYSNIYENLSNCKYQKYMFVKEFVKSMKYFLISYIYKLFTNLLVSITGNNPKNLA